MVGNIPAIENHGAVEREAMRRRTNSLPISLRTPPGVLISELLGRFNLTPKEMRQAKQLAKDHKRIRVYRSRDRSITLSRDAMYSLGVRETFWLRIPNTPQDRAIRRRGFLIPRQRPNAPHEPRGTETLNNQKPQR